jgi:endonuclease/exonuclease/phosphatase (EEP) superfamily protein YafD
VRNPGLSVPSIISDINWQGQVITMVATHPLPPTNGAYFRARNTHFQEMAQEIQKLPNATIVLGDLNLTMWSPYYQQFVNSTHLRNSRQGFGIQPTWGHRTHLFQIPIDHCLFSSAFYVQNNRVGQEIGSDHRPMITDLKLR